ncbi:MAG: ABC transporter ATP-binding protein [Oligoflexus sp.]
MTKALQLVDLSVSYGKKKALHTLDLTVNAGECIGIIGPNGSGKSTLLKAILGFLPADTGEVLIDGISTRLMDHTARSRQIAYVPQDSGSDANFKVTEFLEMGQYPWMKMTDADERRKRLEKIVRCFDLGNLLDRRFHQLSGGERQRVHLAQSLLQEPKILLLDEITNHLDIYYQLEILKALHLLPQTKLIALHDLNLAARFCDRLLLLSGGVMQACGTAKDVLQRELIEDLYRVKSQFLTHPDGHILLAFE